MRIKHFCGGDSRPHGTLELPHRPDPRFHLQHLWVTFVKRCPKMVRQILVRQILATLANVFYSRSHPRKAQHVRSSRSRRRPAGPKFAALPGQSAGPAAPAAASPGSRCGHPGDDGHGPPDLAVAIARKFNGKALKRLNPRPGFRRPGGPGAARDGLAESATERTRRAAWAVTRARKTSRNPLKTLIPRPGMRFPPELRLSPPCEQTSRRQTLHRRSERGRRDLVGRFCGRRSPTKTAASP